MKTSELFAKLEEGYVLEFRSRNYPADKSRFTGFYRQPAYEYEGHAIQAAHYRFGWGSAIGTIDDYFLAMAREPELFSCENKKLEEYQSGV